jgi:hypothetical protein
LAGAASAGGLADVSGEGAGVDDSVAELLEALQPATMESRIRNASDMTDRLVVLVNIVFPSGNRSPGFWRHHNDCLIQSTINSLP